MTAPVSMSLQGRTVVITGAGQGLGETTAHVVGALGASVAVLDIDGAAAKRVTDDLTAAGATALAVEADVADEPAMAAAAAAVVARFGTVHGLVANAGVISWTPIEDLDVAEWDRVMAVNARGLLLGAKHFGPPMLAQRAGSIVTISSVAGTVPEARAGAYSPSKAAAIMFARQLAVEWGPRGVRSNAVSPGIMRTPMAERFNSDPEALRGRLQMIASRRIGDPAEVASVIAFLLGDASSFVNGQNLEVDGGMMQMLIDILPRPGVPEVRS
jgi:NAD(P)-dependent dehydrogenase (short-subunit alcohol dehydrogenase family)